MELKEGMYVRTKEGLIDKVIIDYKGCCNSPNCNCKHVTCEYNYYDEENIIKASYNLIDLIERGDYINGDKVTEEMIKMRDKQGVFGLPDKHRVFIDEIKVKNMVTKEMFNSVKYEVE